MPDNVQDTTAKHDPDENLTLAEAAEILKTSRRQVERLIKEGRLPRRTIGIRQLRLKRRDLDVLLEPQQPPPCDPPEPEE